MTADEGVRTMKSEMLRSLNTRFIDIEDKEHLALATLLDPCFKNRFFSEPDKRDKAKDLLISLISSSTSESVPMHDGDPPAQKRVRTEVMKCMDEIMEEATSQVSATSEGISLVDQFLAEQCLSYRDGNAYKWWADNWLRFKPLADLAQWYLSPPPTSVPSERLFSEAGDIYDEKRNRLAPEKAEMLLFIKNNYHLL